MSGARPASAQQYTAFVADGIVKLEDAGSATAVSIIPSAGNVTSAFTINGHEILRWPYKSLDDFKARPGLNGIPLLAPWANRLDEQGFYASGRRHAFDMNIGNVRGDIPIHGFLSYTDQWQLIEAGADAGSAWVTSRLEFWKQPLWMRQFPFAHTIEMTHRLEDGTLHVLTSIVNLGTDPMPIAIGFHPYFQLSDQPRDAWTIRVPARLRWLLSDIKVPTGETEPATKLFPCGQAVLKDYDLDDVFGDLERDAEGRAHVILKGLRQQLDVMLGPTYKALVLYSPHASNFICFEPMAGITNGMNLSQRGAYDEQQYVAPGSTWDGSFWVKPSGF